LDKTIEELKQHASKKLEHLGDYFTDYLTEITGNTHYSHVAQRARRKVNPPIDSWVAFGTNKRGYKMLPHFQIGLFKDHAFCQYGIIYEAPAKSTDRKSTRLNSSHVSNSYAVFCLNKTKHW